MRLIESPQDLRSVLRQATLALAPMRCGAGVPIKVLEAWTCGVPVVASPWAVAGTTGRQGEDFRIVGQHPIEWVSAFGAPRRPRQRERLADNGRRRLAVDYSREIVREQLLDVIREIEPAKAGGGDPRAGRGGTAGVGFSCLWLSLQRSEYGYNALGMVAMLRGWLQRPGDALQRSGDGYVGLRDGYNALESVTTVWGWLQQSGDGCNDLGMVTTVWGSLQRPSVTLSRPL